jgi:hypothetical protein
MGPAGHRLVEYAVSLGVLGKVLEVAHAELVVESHLAGPHAVEQIAPRPVLLLSVHDGKRSHRAGRLTPEQFRKRGERKGAGTHFREDTDTGERPQHALERWGMGVSRRCQISAVDGPVGQQVGDAQLGGDIEGLRDPIARHHLE